MVTAVEVKLGDSFLRASADVSDSMSSKAHSSSSARRFKTVKWGGGGGGGGEE